MPFKLKQHSFYSPKKHCRNKSQFIFIKKYQSFFIFSYSITDVVFGKVFTFVDRIVHSWAGWEMGTVHPVVGDSGHCIFTCYQCTVCCLSSRIDKWPPWKFCTSVSTCFSYSKNALPYPLSKNNAQVLTFLLYNLYSPWMTLASQRFRSFIGYFIWQVTR